MFASDISPARRAELLEKIAGRIVSLRLGLPAVVLLEASKPISFLGSQFMIFLRPVYHALFTFTEYDEIAALLEERDNVEYLIQAIERREADAGAKK